MLLSGSALSPWAVQLDAERAATSVARQVGCEVRRDLTPCLQRAPLARLLQATLPTPAFLPRVGPPPANIILSGVDPERAMKEKTGNLQYMLACQCSGEILRPCALFNLSNKLFFYFIFSIYRDTVYYK